jgi:hypothetical protein
MPRKYLCAPSRDKKERKEKLILSILKYFCMLHPPAPANEDFAFAIFIQRSKHINSRPWGLWEHPETPCRADSNSALRNEPLALANFINWTPELIIQGGHAAAHASLMRN